MAEMKDIVKVAVDAYHAMLNSILSVSQWSSCIRL